MRKLSTFQIVVTALFIVFIILGVLLFAGVGGFGRSDTDIGEVVMWGVYDDKIIDPVIKELSFDDSRFDQVKYVEKDPRTFDADLVEALAAGQGPDIFFLKQDTILRHKDKILPISYDLMSKRAFRDTFIEEGELFLGTDGIFALPFIIDPLVLYWNRSHYANTGISRPPQFWDELLSFAIDSSLTKRGEGGAITQSAFSIGEYRNILHAKELLSLLVLQAGSPITEKSADDGVVSSALLLRLPDGQSPAENALRFYTDFANPSKSVYTWNRALPEAQKAFVSGILSNYIGFASELGSIREQNANLNFDVSLVPRVRSGTSNVTFGDMTGLAVPKASRNVNGALQIVFALTSDTALEKFSSALNLAPVSRNLLVSRPTDPFRVIFADATLQSRGWLDPDTALTEGIFKTMIESVVSGQLRVSEAVNTAHREMENLLR